MKGYTGKILTVDLTTGDCKEIKITDEIYEKILSGVGLGVWWCYRNIPAGADPLGPENVIGITSGMLTDTGSCITGRWVVVAKSPSTGGIGEANCGGTFAPGIKACGYDSIFFTGKSEKPVYVYIDNNGPQIRDASHVWGLDATQAEEKLLDECYTKGKKKPVACTIGMAGERQSWMAGICNDRGRIAARQGLGGVMGSKNLKGVVLAGTRKVSCEDPQGMKELSKKVAKKIKMVTMPPIVPTGLLHVGRFLPELELSPTGLVTGSLMGTWGTVGSSTLQANTGESPIKNWGGSMKDFGINKVNKTDGSKILTYQKKKYFCHSCVYGCGGEVDITGTKYNKGEYGMSHKPEYETQWVFTGILLSDDIDMMLWINEYLNRAGIDTISIGHCVAMAIECYENGILTKEDFDGLEMNWGNAEAIIEFTKMIVERRGLGDVFADGTKKAAERLGRNTERFAVNAGGLEPPMHDSRIDSQLATLYATDPTPAKHTTGGYLYYGCMHLWDRVSWAPKGKLVGSAKAHNVPSENESLKTAAAAYYRRLVDGIGGCYFAMILGVNNYPVFDWLNIATGWNRTPDEYMFLGKRIWTMRQMFNIKQGLDPWYSRPHGRMVGEPPLKAGKLKGITIPIDELMKQTWEVYGWDRETGVPTKETVEELGLNRLLDAPDSEFTTELDTFNALVAAKEECTNG